ncbi:MAG TPA: hypothetical protein VNX88_03905, partial [Terriglobales bacterium]|nr:hypothetical protein [Terriglobales bacterium]
SVAPQVVGGPDHPVSCPAGSQAQGGIPGPQSKTGLRQSEVVRATLARNHRMFELMQDPAVDRVEVGRSEDNPNESAVVLLFNQRPRLPIPSQIDGVRTRVIFSPTVASPQGGQHEIAAVIADSELSKARTAKEQHAEELMTNAAILGVGVGASNDSPGEAALVVFVEAGKSAVVPNLIDGVRTRVISTDPFRTFNWGKRTANACSRK